MEKFLLSRDNSILVIVDIQEKLVAAMKNGDKVIENCLHLIEAAKLLQIPVILTEQYPKGLGLTVDKIKDAISTYEPIEKITFDCTGAQDFIKKLKALNKTHIILTGMEAHVCVLQTCLSLLKNGYSVHLVSDAVCSRKEEDFLTGREMMRDAGAVITCTEIVLFQLLEKAGTPEFKAISKRIK